MQERALPFGKPAREYLGVRMNRRDYVADIRWNEIVEAFPSAENRGRQSVISRRERLDTLR